MSLLKQLPILLFSLGIITSAQASNHFKLTSAAASSQGTMPSQYTCSGQDISPPLTWSGAPRGTRGYALVISDPDAPGGTFYHWIIYNIPNTTTQLAPAAKLPKGTQSDYNSAQKLDYFGPCPPQGDSPHHYVFTLYALNKLLTQADGTWREAIPKYTLAKTEYVMRFGR